MSDLYRFSKRAKRYVRVKADFPVAALKELVEAVNRLAEEDDLPGEVRAAIDAFLRAVDRAFGPGEDEVLPEQHKTAAERVQEMEEGYKSMVQKQVDQAMDVYLKQMEVQTKSLLSSQPPILSPEQLTEKVVERAQDFIHESVQRNREDARTSALRARLQAEIERGKLR